MISHEHRCIFIHIPRCAGSSIETWIAGDDWWNVNSPTKHILASQAKLLYAEYWDSYFKFSIVRNPYTRMSSCLKYDSHFGLSATGGFINFNKYHDLFGHDVIIEHDHRFYSRENIISPSHSPGLLYGNILDESLDFVGRFETLEADMEHVRRSIGKADPFRFHVEATDKSVIQHRLTQADREHISLMFKNDFDKYGYAKE